MTRGAGWIIIIFFGVGKEGLGAVGRSSLKLGECWWPLTVDVSVRFADAADEERCGGTAGFEAQIPPLPSTIAKKSLKLEKNKLNK